MQEFKWFDYDMITPIESELKSISRDDNNARRKKNLKQIFHLMSRRNITHIFKLTDLELDIDMSGDRFTIIVKKDSEQEPFIEDQVREVDYIVNYFEEIADKIINKLN